MEIFRTVVDIFPTVDSVFPAVVGVSSIVVGILSTIVGIIAAVVGVFAAVVSRPPTVVGIFPAVVLKFPTVVANFPTVVLKPPTVVFKLPAVVGVLPAVVGILPAVVFVFNTSGNIVKPIVRSMNPVIGSNHLDVYADSYVGFLKKKVVEPTLETCPGTGVVVNVITPLVDALFIRQRRTEQGHPTLFKRTRDCFGRWELIVLCRVEKEIFE